MRAASLRRRALVVLAVVAATGAAPRAARADDEAARRHFRHGVELYDDKRYADALEEFRAAYREKPSPGIQQNIALSLEALGRPVEAAQAFDLALAGGDALSPQTREAITRELAALSKQVATIRFSLVDVASKPVPGATVSVDGAALPEGAVARPVRLAPGIHVFTAHADGFADPPSKKLALESGQPVDATFVFGGAVGTLTIRPSVEGAVVRVDGAEVGRGAWTGELPAGPHHVDVAAPGFQTTSSDVAVTAGATVDYPVTLHAPGDAPAPYVAPRRKVARPKKAYVVPSAALMAGSLRLSGATGEPPDGSRRDFGGAEVGLRGGYHVARDIALELFASFGGMSAKYRRTPTDVVDSSTSVALFQIAPGVRVSTRGSVRFTAGTAFGLAATGVESKIARPGATDDVKGSGVAFAWMLDAGAQFDLGPVFLEGLVFGDVWGVGPVRDKVSTERMLQASPASRFGLRVGLGIPF